MKQIKVLIAGVGGASLGTEIIKSLLLANSQNTTHVYEIYACDISPIAYGLHMAGVKKAFAVNLERYVQDIYEYCKNEDIQYILPGGEEPTLLLSAVRGEFQDADIVILANAPDVVKTCNNKALSFETLKGLGFNIPESFTIKTLADLDTVDVRFPCVIKPSTGTGGSHFVYLVDNAIDLRLYCKLLFDNGKDVLVQAYVPLDEGEYTIGVLSAPDRSILGSIALQRSFSSKLSYSFKGDLGLISSGYSQGRVDDFCDLRQQAEKIAIKLGSEGPLNVQARVVNGNLIPFEINPRFSASTYLRSLAGFNEVDVYIRYLEMGERRFNIKLQKGYYLRSLTENFIPF